MDSRLSSGDARRLQISVKELVTRATPVSPHESGLEDVILIGKKDMKMTAIDVENGEVFKCTSAACKSPLNRNAKVSRRLLVGRTDYIIQALDSVDGSEKWASVVGEYLLHRLSGQNVMTSNHGQVRYLLFLSDESPNFMIQ